MSDAIRLAYSAIPVFHNDGTIDDCELSFLLGMALRDGKIDDDEKRVLGNIFKRVSRSRVTERVWKRIQEVIAKYGISW